MKKITIDGTTNRYLMKRVMQTNSKEPIPLKNHSATIGQKISNYKQQDIRRGIYNSDKFVSLSKITELMSNCDMKCYFCTCIMLLEYKTVRDMKQWTVDRIDNDHGHNEDNVILCCLQCNLKRRRRQVSAFWQTENLIIKKIDP